MSLTDNNVSGTVIGTMLIIRLQRVGRKNYADYRIIVTEHARAAKSVSYLEIVGHHNPNTDTTTIDAEKVKGWISKGAQVSDTVHNLLVTNKIIEGKKKNVLPKKTPIVKEEEVKEEAEVVEKEEVATPDETEKEEVTDKVAEEEVKA